MRSLLSDNTSFFHFVFKLSQHLSCLESRAQTPWLLLYSMVRSSYAFALASVDDLLVHWFLMTGYLNTSSARRNFSFSEKNTFFGSAMALNINTKFKAKTRLEKKKEKQQERHRRKQIDQQLKDRDSENKRCDAELRCALPDETTTWSKPAKHSRLQIIRLAF